MVYTVNDLVSVIAEKGLAQTEINNPLAQFGELESSYQFSLILPEMTKLMNSYVEEDIRLQEIPPAFDTPRYGVPVLGETGLLSTSLEVAFGETSLGSQLPPDKVDELNHYLKMTRAANTDSLATSEEMVTLLNLVYMTTIKPHLDKNEAQRGQAIVKGMVSRRAANASSQDVEFFRPATNVLMLNSGTVAAPTGWYGAAGALDPADTFYAVRQIFDDLGLTCVKILTDRTLADLLSRNPAILARSEKSKLVINAGQVLADTQVNDYSVEMEDLGGVLAQLKMPNLTIYKRTHPYYDFAGTRIRNRRFMDFKDGYNYMVFLANTDRELGIRLPEEEPIILKNAIGYYGLGTVATRGNPGRYVNIDIPTRHPKIPYIEAMQTGFPVIQNPDSIVVVGIRQPTP